MARFDDFTAHELDVLDAALELLHRPDRPVVGDLSARAGELLSELRGHDTTDERADD